jgi:hypothetical protein
MAVALGCGATAGSTWVTQPEPGPFVSDTDALSASENSFHALDEPKTSQAALEVAFDEERRPRPRLNRTVTLGEAFVSTAERSGAPQAPVGAPLAITINNYVAAPNPYYSGYYGAPFIADGFRPIDGGTRPAPPSAQPAPMQPGQNWPALPSYGPAFPFKTAPASPWERSR